MDWGAVGEGEGVVQVEDEAQWCSNVWGYNEEKGKSRPK